MALVDRAAGWLTRACEPYAALEPRFWTVPPAYHVQELCFCLLVAVAAAVTRARHSAMQAIHHDHAKPIKP